MEVGDDWSFERTAGRAGRAGRTGREGRDKGGYWPFNTTGPKHWSIEGPSSEL
jgi:hypothetical protein